jgi:hypothetical protein
MMFMLYVLTTHDLENSLIRHWPGPEGASLVSCDQNCMLLSEWLQAKWPAFLNFCFINIIEGAWGSVVVKVLRY